MNYNGDYGAFAGLFAGTAAIIIMLVVIIMIISLAVAAMQIIGQWKLFTKAKEEGWKAIIPVYNQIVLCKLVGVSPWWILIVFSLGVLSSIPILGALIAVCYTAAIIYFLVILNISVARSYGKDDVWAIGLIFLAPVFYLILGLSKDTKYVGAKPMNDPVWEWLVKTFNTEDDKVSEAKVTEVNMIKCPKCDAEIAEGTKFCPNCGKKIGGKK